MAIGSTAETWGQKNQKEIHFSAPLFLPSPPVLLSQGAQRGEAATNEKITAEYSEYAETRAASVLLPRILRIPRSLLCRKNSFFCPHIFALASGFTFSSDKRPPHRNGILLPSVIAPKEKSVDKPIDRFSGDRLHGL